MEPSGASQGQRGALTFSNEGRTQAQADGGDGPSAAAPPRERRLPMWLGLALLAHLVSNIAVSLRLQLAFSGRSDYGGDLHGLIVRWNTLSAGLSAALLVLAAAGAAELVRRTSDRARQGARLLFGGLLALVALSLYYSHAHYRMQASRSFDELEALLLWTRWLRATIWLLITAGALLVGWRERRVRRWVAPLVLAHLLAHPYDLYSKALYALFEGRWALHLQSWSFDAVYVALLVVVLRLGAPLAEASGGWERAGRALDRAASALYARLWISVAGITLMLLSVGQSASEGFAKLWVLGVPLGVAVANLGAVSGVFGAAGLTEPGAPRRSLYLAGTLLVMATFLSALQMLQLFHSWPDLREVAEMLPLATSVIAALALGVLAQALTRLAALLPSLELAQQASTSRLTVILSQLAVVGVQYYLVTSPPRGLASLVLILGLSASASIVTLMSQARLCRALAEQIRERNELPAATVVTG